MKKRLGEVLIAQGWVSPDQLNLALREQEQTRERIGQVLMRLGLVTDAQLAQAFAIQLGLPYCPLHDPSDLDLEAIERNQPLTLAARDGRALPLVSKNGVPRMAVADPFDVSLLDQLKQLRPKAQIEVAPAGQISRFGIGSFVEREAQATVRALLAKVEKQGVVPLEEADPEKGPIPTLVRSILEHAVFQGASDIHFEPTESTMRVRYRIDGVMHHIYSLPARITRNILSYLKLQAKIDISENRKPQEGRISFDARGRQVDIRVSIYPGAHGQSVVLRILDRRVALLTLDQLGFDPWQVAQLERIIRRPHGIFLLTGPTGSGKTTTLYAALQRISSIAVNIMTIEDPVEYTLPLVKQSQVNEAVNFGFAEALRAALRHDPDVVLVGEIRDAETAEIAARAALTGHLVFSTLHTNSAVDAIVRLTDMGISRGILAASLIAVAGQRLVRRVCPHCAAPAKTGREEEEIIRAVLAGKLPDRMNMQVGTGCGRCHDTGYAGRLSIAEIMELSRRLRGAIATGVEAIQIEEQARREEKFRGMFEIGVLKVVAGKTTLGEIRRVCEWEPISSTA